MSTRSSYPRAAERSLARELARITRANIKLSQKYMNKYVLPLYEAYVTGDRAALQKLYFALNELRTQLLKTVIEAAALRVAYAAIRRVQIFVALELQRQARAAGLAINPITRDPRLSRAVAERVQETVQLIKSIPAKYHQRVQRAVLRGIQEGQMTITVAKEIREVGNVSLRRARIIARDQTAKGVSALTEAQHRGLGLTKFRWITAQDERVRPAHRRLHGKIFSWAEGAPEHIEPARFPGRAILCRCQAVPVYEELRALFGGEHGS